MEGPTKATQPGPRTASSGSIASESLALTAVWLLTSAALLIGAADRIKLYSRGTGIAVVVIVAFLLQLKLYLLPGFAGLRARMEATFPQRSRAMFLGGILLAPWVIYALGTGAIALVPALKLISLAAVVLGVYALWPPRRAGFTVQDVVVLGMIAAPTYVNWYRDVWPVPVYLDVMARLLVVGMAAFAVLSVRRLSDVGYEWQLKAGDWLEGGKQFVFFSIIGLPLGFAMRFIGWHPKQTSPLEIAFSFLGIFMFIAVAEELFFRGILQNLLEKSMRSVLVARAIASALFGLSHIHHGFPNWRYVIMAAIAGWFYGTAWHRRRNIIASCVTHALVDTVWHHFFTA